MAIIKPTAKAGVFKPQNKFGSKGKHAGGKGGFGGGKGGGGGTWMFVPAGGPVAPQWGGAPSWGKGGGKGHGGKGGKGGKGKGKVQDKASMMRDATMEKLGKIDADRKVWIGGLAEDTKRGAINEHFKEVGKLHDFAILKKGHACVCFKNAEDASSAIAMLNGSDIGGNTIEVDVWTQKEKKDRPERAQKPQKTKAVIGNTFAKGQNKFGKNPAMVEKLKALDHTLKVWVGGLDHKTTWKQLKQHFVDNGSEPDVTDLMKPGTACVAFKSEDEASTAIATLNGTEIDGKTLEVDVWTKPEKKEKKKKEA